MQVDISIEQAKMLYKQGGVAKNIALSLFHKRDLIPHSVFSWESFVKNWPYYAKEYYIATNSSICIASNDIRTSTDKNLLSSKEQAQAILSLIQLLRFYESWNCQQTIVAYGIVYSKEGFKVHSLSQLNHTPLFTFPNETMAVDFINTFSEYFNNLKYLYER